MTKRKKVLIWGLSIFFAVAAITATTISIIFTRKHNEFKFNFSDKSIDVDFDLSIKNMGTSKENITFLGTSNKSRVTGQRKMAGDLWRFGDFKFKDSISLDARDITVSIVVTNYSEFPISIEIQGNMYNSDVTKTQERPILYMDEKIETPSIATATYVISQTSENSIYKENTYVFEAFFKKLDNFSFENALYKGTGDFEKFWCIDMGLEHYTDSNKKPIKWLLTGYDTFEFDTVQKVISAVGTKTVSFISAYGLEGMSYQNSYDNNYVVPHTNGALANNYYYSNVRAYLNGESVYKFAGGIDGQEGVIPTGELSGELLFNYMLNNNKLYSLIQKRAITELMDTITADMDTEAKDMFWLPSSTEIQEMFSSDELRRAKISPNDFNTDPQYGYYFLRDGGDSGKFVKGVSESGAVTSVFAKDRDLVRPAFNVKFVN